MADPTTANMQFAVPTRGSDTGTWDVPVNGNANILDLVLGGIATIGLAASNVVLASSQFQSRTITFNSTLLASVTITFPSTFIKSYEILNSCTGSSVFTITLLTTTSSGQAICAPPGEVIEMFSNGTDLKFKNFGRIGTYWDYAGSSVPAWVSGCTVPPYLNCDGTQFSSATYPALHVVLGSTTLPDSRGRFRASLNQTSSRIQSSVSGLDGTVFAAGGGSQFMHNHGHGVTDPQHTHTNTVTQAQFAVSGGVGSVLYGAGVGGGAGAIINSAATNLTVNNSTLSGTAQNIPPAYIGGLTLVRAG